MVPDQDSKRSPRDAPRIHEEETEDPPRGRRTLTGREASQEDYRKQIISVEILPANSPDTPPRSNVSGLESSSGIAADARAKFPSITAAGVVTIESSRSAQVSRTRRFKFVVGFVRRTKEISLYLTRGVASCFPFVDDLSKFCFEMEWPRHGVVRKFS